MVVKKKKHEPRARRVEAGVAAIGRQEKETARIQEEKQISAKSARRQAGEKIGGEREREIAQTPEAIAQKGIDIDRAEQIILLEERLQKEGNLPVEDVEDEKGRETIRERIERLTAEGEAATAAGEEPRIIKGTLPLGPAGALTAATKVGGLLGKQAKLNQLFKGSSNTQILSKVKLKEAFKLNGKQADAIIDKYNKFTTSQIVKELTKTPRLFSPKLIKTTGKVIGVVAGADTIFAWYALDNISDGLLFQARRVEQDLKSAEMSLEEAEELFRESDIAYDLALKKIDQSARFNPLTFGSRKLIVKGAQIKRKEYDLIKRSLGL